MMNIPRPTQDYKDGLNGLQKEFCHDFSQKSLLRFLVHWTLVGRNLSLWDIDLIEHGFRQLEMALNRSEWRKRWFNRKNSQHVGIVGCFCQYFKVNIDLLWIFPRPGKFRNFVSHNYTRTSDIQIILFQPFGQTEIPCNTAIASARYGSQIQISDVDSYMDCISQQQQISRIDHFSFTQFS